MLTNQKEKIVFIFSLLLVGVVYFLTQIKPQTSYNYFILLAKQLMQGKIYLDTNPSWLNELIPAASGKWYVVYPPMPAIIAVPFIKFGIESQTLISLVFGVLNFIILYWVLHRLYKWKLALGLTLAFILGTNHWYLATEGSAWYISHITAITFILIAFLLLKIRQKNDQLITTNKMTLWFLSGLTIGAAYWSRLPDILILPFFIFLTLNKTKQIKLKNIFLWQKLALLLIGVVIFVTLNFIYNYLRFNTFSDVGYTKIPGVLQERWYTSGIFSLSYLPRNIRFILTKFPPSFSQFPFAKPSLEGMAIWLTSPFLLLTLFVNWRKKWVLALIFSGIAMIIPGFLHGTVGFSQFGYRFALEGSLCFLISLGTIKNKKILQILLPILIILSIGINFWGIYFIRYLHIWSL